MVKIMTVNPKSLEFVSGARVQSLLGAGGEVDGKMGDSGMIRLSGSHGNKGTQRNG